MRYFGAPLLALFAGCVDSPTETGRTGLSNGDGGTADASLPKEDAGWMVVSPPGSDGGQPDGGCQCEPEDECHVGVCDPVDGCLQTLAPDGTPCGLEGNLCVSGECVLGGCGDGYREPGPMLPREACDDGNLDETDACDSACSPLVITIASRTGGWDETPAIGIDDDGNALVVWVSEAGDDDPDDLVVARRFTASGVALDPIAIPLELTRVPLGYDASPVVVGLESGWLVAWSAPSPQPQARYRRVLLDGTMSSDRSVSGIDSRSESDVRGARTSDAVVLTYLELDTGRLMARALDPGGRARTPAFEVGTATRNYAVASSASQWLAVFDSGAREVLAQRFEGTDEIDAEAFSVAVDAAGASAVRLESGDFALAWTSFAVDALGDVRARVVRSMGEPLDTVAIDIAVDPLVAEAAPAIVARAGSSFAVAYQLGREMGSSIAFAGGGLAPAELSLVSPHLAPPGVRGGLVTAPSARGSWLAWHARGPSGDPAAFRSVFAFVLPPE